MEDVTLPKRFILGLCFLTLLASLSGAQDDQPSTAASKGSFERWNLKDWLEQKNRNTLMDMWLVTHTPSPYEFYVSGTLENYTASTTSGGVAGAKTSVISEQGSIGAFATVTGLVGEFENNTSEGFTDLTGSLQVRVLGPAVQGSHLLLIGGIRDRQYNSKNADVLLSNNFAGLNLDLDITRFFGIQIDYRYYLPVNGNALGNTQGHRLEAGAFIDFKKLRIFGNFYHETQDSVLNQVDTRTNRDGIISGITLFF